MNWRNLPECDYFLYARSYHTAAKNLIRMLDVDPDPVSEYDLCPILSMYRHAIELHLKIIVLGKGANFLVTKPDELSVHKTRSLSWLAQLVMQIVTALRWEAKFTTDGINDLAEFKKLLTEANEFEVMYQAFRGPVRPERPEALKSAILDYVRRLDALIALLQHTADALVAEWHFRQDPVFKA